MTALEKFKHNFNLVVERSSQPDGSIKLPYMVRISQSLANDPELRSFLDIQNDRAEYMGVVINVVSDFTVVDKHEDAFPRKK